MSALDDQLADERRRLQLVRDLTDKQRMDLLTYLCRWAALPIDAWFFDREADSSGVRYDAWGRVSRGLSAPAAHEPVPNETSP